jgi:hypothetical protein
MEMPVDSVKQPEFPLMAEGIKKYVEDPEEAQNKVKRNRCLERLMIMNDSLWSRDDRAIAWDYPLQTLIWEKSENGPVLVPRNPPLQDKTKHIPWGLVDMLKDDMGEFTVVIWRRWPGSIVSTEANPYYILYYVVAFSYLGRSAQPQLSMKQTHIKSK